MKKFLCFALAAVLIVCTLAGCSKNNTYTFEHTDTAEHENASVIRTVTFNCAAPWGNLLKGTSSSARVKRFAEYMNTVKPDIIGTQEMNSKWMEKLGTLMPEYDSYGVKRGGDENENKSEMNSVFWLKDKYTCHTKGTFWLSETPEKESRYDGAGCNRIATYAVLIEKKTQMAFLFMNTHLDNASDEARAFGAQVILDKISEITMLSDYLISGIILTGDFNDTYDSSPYNLITQNLTDAHCTIKSTVEPVRSTYHDWGKLEDSEQPIDFIFSNLSSARYLTLDDTPNGFISDHYGVYADILF